MQTKKWIFISILICFTSQIIYGQYKEFMYDDSVRTYAVYEPSLDPNTDGHPLVIGLHGTGADGSIFMATASLIQKANNEKFIVACPDALLHNLFTYFNAGGGFEELTNGTDDLGFISALIDTMIKNYDVDTTRIYATGHSNGSMMSYRLAAEISHRIAAIGCVAAPMLYEYCNPEYPVPIIHFHGLSDTTCPYEGIVKDFVVIPHMDSTLAKWREINDCSPIPETILNENGVIGKKWPSSTGNSDIILYTVESCGHGWPDFNTYGISATDVIWDFLKLHNRSSVTDIEDDDIHSIPMDFKLYQNYPNPFNPSTMIKYKLNKSSHISLKIYNLAGQEIETLVNEFQLAGEYEITWQPNGLPSGLYFYKIQPGDPSSSSPRLRSEQAGHRFSETKKLILQK